MASGSGNVANPGQRHTQPGWEGPRVPLVADSDPRSHHRASDGGPSHRSQGIATEADGKGCERKGGVRAVPRRSGVAIIAKRGCERTKPTWGFEVPSSARCYGQTTSRPSPGLAIHNLT